MLDCKFTTKQLIINSKLNRDCVKIICLLAFLFFGFNANATNYYLSNSGNDANNGTNASAPWQTLNKLNSFKNLKPGDSVLFRRRDIFYGGLTVSRSGNIINPIVFSTYGTGDKPILTGFKTLATWTNEGGGIYSASVKNTDRLNAVSVNNNLKSMGRYPNTGYLTYQSHTRNTSITSSALTGVPNWAGAEVVIRKYRWILDRHEITAQSGSTLTYNSLKDYGNNAAYSPVDGNGFFIQGSLATLDTLHEWFYDKPASKLYMFFGGNSPAFYVIKASDIDINVAANSRRDIIFTDLQFEGANRQGLDASYSTKISVNNCDFINQGGNGVYSIQGSLSVSGGSMLNILNNGVFAEHQNTSTVVSGVSFENIGVIKGAGRSGDASQIGIYVGGNNTTVSDNTLKRIGYNGIHFVGNDVLVSHNLVDSFCLVKDDGGGIYTVGNFGTNYNNRVIKKNIILNAIGTTEALPSDYWTPNGKGAGIYLDDYSNNIKVDSNTVAFCNWRGIFIHESFNCSITNNNVYNNYAQIVMEQSSKGNIFGIALNNNKLVAVSEQSTLHIITFSADDYNLFGSFSNNYYARPINDGNTIRINPEYSGSSGEKYISLSKWKTDFTQDANSKKSPKIITDVNDLRFEYNASLSSKDVNLEANYIDITGKEYNGKITIAPYSSYVLIKTGSFVNYLPIANAGTDQTITFPISSVSLSGSGKGGDGTITTFLWTKISGSSTGFITDINAAVTSVTGLIQGTYQFELKVTDNNGAVGKDTVQVTVNPAPNIPPIANAGGNKIITFPLNITTLNGSGTDADGTIVSYFWIKISGPAPYSIVNSASPVTDITGLVQGTYRFELKVSDNSGAVGRDTMHVIVNQALNVLPVPNAGGNKTITLPVNKTTLTGSGTDEDGTISNYLWTKISGPVSYSFVNASSAVTDISGLVKGTYQFELKVTDNHGAFGRDTMTVIVNPALNIPPVANAGGNKIITLPVNKTTLIGDGTDEDGSIVNYLWTKILGPTSYNILNPGSAVTDVTGLVQGIYRFELKVTDNNGDVGKDTVTVTVNAAANIPPVANAGGNKTITLPVNKITLNGSGADIDGAIVNYLWTKISGPDSYSIINTSSAVTDVSGIVMGTYQFELKVTDNHGAFGRDTMTVTVNPALNIPPVAKAGSNKSITLPVNKTTLGGNSTDSDGMISSYLWTKISGPSSFTIINASSAVTDVNDLVQGVYQFELKVTDNSGAFGEDTIHVIVNPALNIPPVAYVGANKIITLPINKTNLSGSGADVDGTITNYLWTKISGPATFSILNAASAATEIIGLVQGIYQFELKVTDNNGGVGRDTMIVIVNPAPNMPPVANAGYSKTITLPVNKITLSGSGVDIDGTIVNYLWTKISGPSSFTIINASSAVSEVNGLFQGTYRFELKVTDNNGDVGKDTVTVTVNAAANIPPVANAGGNKTITLPINKVTHSGSGTDADGTITNYLWTKISGPSSFTIINASSAVTVVSGLVQGTYRFELKVTDNNDAVGRDTMTVIVNPAPNIPPVANAGDNKTITLPVNKMTLSGGGADIDGTIVNYLWTKISGPSSFTIINASSAVTEVTSLVLGTYQFELKVTDNNGAVGRDTMTVTVNPAPNIPPVANAGDNKTIILPVNKITLSGSGTDADGMINSYLWTKISGPASYSIVNAASAVTEVTGLVQGVYLYELQVTDNVGAIGRDTMQVIVNPAPNIPPIASAGGNKTITLPINQITISGSGADVNGTITDYLWTKISGPASFTIINASSAVTEVTSLEQGTYQFELKVTDNNGAVGRDTIQVIVYPAPNVPPVVSAGSNKTITLPLNKITLSGSGADADGTISSYLWTKISGPDSYNFVNSSSAVTDVTGLIIGVYQFELKVTDNNGAVAKDTMQVIVNPSPNIPPVANAGDNKTITLPVNKMTLTGSGTDADGTISNFLWTKISGPSSYSIVNATSPVTDVSGLVQGTYQFELKVKDNNGAVGRDTVKVTVNPAPNIVPVANAGSDKTITLPINKIALAGSGRDEDGEIETYIWTKISGPDSFNIVNPASPVTDASGLVEGVYQFVLTVTDNNGGIGKDNLHVTVKAADNIPSVANAGPDLTVTLPVDNTVLKGSGTNADGTILSYLWQQIAGPNNSTIHLVNTASPNITDLIGGTYKFELTVTDDRNAMDKDTMTLTVALARLAPEEDVISFYPNPVINSGILEIHSKIPSSVLSIVLIDASGKIINQKRSIMDQNTLYETLDMSNIPQGTFTLVVYFDQMRKQTLRIVKM